MAANSKQKIRVPSQKRGQEALDSLLNAGEELLSEFGYEGFTMTELSRRAGVSNGAMYWRVENKDALLHAIHERYRERSNVHLDKLRDPARWKGLTVEEAVEKAVRAIADVFLIDSQLMRALSLRAGADPEILRTAAVNVEYGQELFAAALEPHLVEAGHPEPRGAAVGIYGVINGAIGSRITWPEYFDDPVLTIDRFVDRLCAMSVATVRAEI